MFQGFQMIVLVLVVWLCSTALLVVLKTLFSSVIQDIRDNADESPGRSFWLGLINSIFLFALTILFLFLVDNLGIQFIGILGVIIDSIFIIGAIFGLAGMSLLIGDRLFPTLTPFKKKSFAAGITLLACITPIFGWYVLLPYLLLSGFGALLISAYRGYRASRKKEPEEMN